MGQIKISVFIYKELLYLTKINFLLLNSKTWYYRDFFFKKLNIKSDYTQKL